ncbi:hypothetical protein Btru_074743 [Bulinus truncatus]|nr:hypothetical protein Btru_074743 [Bulinus truncatus]
MDPLDIAEFDSLSKSEVKTDHAVNDDLDFVFVDKPALPASSPPKWSSAKGSDLLFSFDEGPAPPEGVKAPPPASFDGQDLFGGELRSPESRRDPFSVESDRRRADDEPQSDLFDDFWDLASVSVVPLDQLTSYPRNMDDHRYVKLTRPRNMDDHRYVKLTRPRNMDDHRYVKLTRPRNMDDHRYVKLTRPRNMDDHRYVKLTRPRNMDDHRYVKLTRPGTWMIIVMLN